MCHGRTRSSARGSGGASAARAGAAAMAAARSSTGSDARHMPAQMRMNRAQSSPAPGDQASSDSSARGRSADSSTLEPSAKR